MNCGNLLTLLCLALSASLLPGCGRDKGSATPQAAQELAELRAEQEQDLAMGADDDMRHEIDNLLSRFGKTADATLASATHRITLLHLACLYKKAELARCLLVDGADPNARMLAEVDGADISSTAEPGTPALLPSDTPLTWATIPLNEEMTAQDLLPLIDLLVQKGADVNQPGPLGMPPLLTAALTPYPVGEAVILHLLELGADSTLDSGYSVCYATAARGWHKALEKLLEKGASITSKEGSALHAAADHAEVAGALECAKILLAHGAEADAPSQDDATPLYLATHALTTPAGKTPELEEATAAMVALLLQHGADPLRCCDADPEFPGSCPADFIAMSPGVQARLADLGLTVPRRPINFEAEGHVLLAEICRASLFDAPAEDIAPHYAKLVSLLLNPPHDVAHSDLYAAAFSHTITLLTRADAARAAELVSRLPLWRNEKAWQTADARTGALMEAILTTPELILPKSSLMEHARLLDSWGVTEAASLLVELLERNAGAEADIESLCADSSPAIRAGALTARLLIARLPAPRDAAVAEWMQENGITEQEAPPALKRALLLTSLERFWYGDMPEEDVNSLVQAMRDIGAPQAAAFYTKLADKLDKPEELDELMAPGGEGEAARFELECATALFLWAQREELQKLLDGANRKLD